MFLLIFIENNSKIWVAVTNNLIIKIVIKIYIVKAIVLDKEIVFKGTLIHKFYNKDNKVKMILMIYLINFHKFLKKDLVEVERIIIYHKINNSNNNRF